jgi:hypothetical protein
MGVDVEIAVEGATEWRHDHRLAKEALDLIGAEGGEWIRVIDGALIISGMSRYYGPGYERGPWPQIYAGLVRRDGEFVGWQLLGDGREVWAMAPPEDDAFQRAQRTLTRAADSPEATP